MKGPRNKNNVVECRNSNILCPETRPKCGTPDGTGDGTGWQTPRKMLIQKLEKFRVSVNFERLVWECGTEREIIV